MSKMTNRQMLTKLPIERQEKILAGAARMNAQRTEAKRLKLLAAEQAAGILNAA